ncbi:hypothetical protein [Domibacillus iocasae]|nr:hypothetical protein [Domibacillus iocasae]
MGTAITAVIILLFYKRAIKTKKENVPFEEDVTGRLHNPAHHIVN